MIKSITLTKAKQDNFFKVLFDAAVMSANSRNHPISAIKQQTEINNGWNDILLDTDTGRITAFARCPICCTKVWVDTKPDGDGMHISGHPLKANCTHDMGKYPNEYVAQNMTEFSKSQLKKWFSKNHSMRNVTPGWESNLIDSLPEYYWSHWTQKNPDPVNDYYAIEAEAWSIKFSDSERAKLGMKNTNRVIRYISPDGFVKYVFYDDNDFIEFRTEYELTR